MATFDSLPDAIDAIRRALMIGWNAIAEPVREELFKLGGLGSSPVDQLVKTAEIVYTHEAVMPQELKEAAAGAARLCVLNGFHGMQIDNRGTLIADILEGVDVPEEDRPEPQAPSNPPVTEPPAA